MSETAKRPRRVREDFKLNLTRVATYLRLNPGATNRQMAEDLGLSYPTVAKSARLVRARRGLRAKPGPKPKPHSAVGLLKFHLSEALNLLDRL